MAGLLEQAQQIGLARYLEDSGYNRREEERKAREQAEMEQRLRAEGRMLPLDIEQSATYGANETFPAYRQDSILPITPPRPINAYTGLPVDTVSDLVYDVAAGLRREPEGRAAQALDVMPRNVADLVAKGISQTETPTLGDYLSGGFDLALAGGPKLIKNYTMNMRNYVDGFYGPNKIPGVALNIGRAFEEGSLNLARKLYSASEVPVATRSVIKTQLAKYKELKKLGDEGGYTEEIKSGMRDAVRKIDGQVAQNILHSKMMANYGEKIPQALRGYAERRFGYEMPFDRQLAYDMFDDVDAKIIYDMSLEAWTGGGRTSLSGGRIQGPSDVLFLNKKNIKAAGDSLSDVGKSRQASVLKSLKAKYDPQTADEWMEVLDRYDPEWKSKVPMKIRQGTDGVFFQFSPAGKRDYLLGGFNAIVKVKNNGTLKMFGTDKQDIFGQKIPGSADAIVGIGTREISIGNKKQLAKKATPKYKNPPKGKEKDVSLASAKESQKTKTKVPRPEQGFLSKEDEALFNAILSDANSIAPDRIATNLAIIGGAYGESD